tara:strand:+ start:5118 stop:5231 length:114 start_codon:yes stop_codon:yes gene_type:complete
MYFNLLSSGVRTKLRLFLDLPSNKIVDFSAVNLSKGG